MENILYYEKIPSDERENFYKSLFIKQYRYLFLPEVCEILKDRKHNISDSSKNYVLSLSRGLFDHCIYLNRIEHIEKEVIFIIHDIYNQFKIFSFSNDETNLLLRKIGNKNIHYSEKILEHFNELETQQMFSDCVEFFEDEKTEKNILTEEIKRLYLN